MKQYIFLLFAAAVLMTGCEKVVDINLNDAAPQYAIEGTVFGGTDTVKVNVAKTTDYYGKAPQQQLSNATVTLSDNAGNSTTIPNIAPGSYQLTGFNGVPGRTYYLNVKVDGKEFTATSTMPAPVNLDSISKEFKSADFRKEGYEIAANFTDPDADKNYYRLVYIINDTLQNKPEDLYILNDKFNNGKKIKADLFRRFEEGDKIEFELRTMDEPVYNFFFSLQDMLNNQNGPAPANPNNNITGGALGYFAAMTRSKKQIVVTQ